MENASKALIMAAGILIALIILGALILMFSNLSNYQDTNIQTDREAQIVEFNNQYVTYDRNDVRGNELISLLNKVVDYNSRKTGDTSDEKYQKMEIMVNGIPPANFKYEDSDKSLIKSSYTQDNVKNNLLDKVQKIEQKYETKYISQLVSNISNIMDTDKGQAKAEEILPKALNKYTGGFSQIKKETQTYYQYSQFKKAYFNCVDRKYNENTGRIIYMQFQFTKIGD